MLQQTPVVVIFAIRSPSDGTPEQWEYLLNHKWRHTELGWFAIDDLPDKMSGGWSLEDALKIQGNRDRLVSAAS